MLKLRLAARFLGCLLGFAALGAHAQTDIAIQVKGYENDTALLAYYMAEQTYIRDTLVRGADGQFHIKADTSTDGGIYLFVLQPKNNYFEFLITGEQDQFTIVTDSSDFVGGMTVKGSLDNKLFYDFLHYAEKKDAEMAPVREQISGLEDQIVGDDTSDSPEAQEARQAREDELRPQIEKLQEKLQAHNQEVMDYRRKLADDNPNTFLATIYNLMMEPEIPDSVKQSDDPKASYYHYREHYWDGVDFGDDRILRTPIFDRKLKTYLDKVVVVHPDSAIAVCDKLLGATHVNETFYRYMLATLYNHYAKSNIMCFDKVYIHLADNYYLAGEAPWVNQEGEFYKELKRRIPFQKNLVCGQRPPMLELKDLNGKTQVMQYQPWKYTIVFFYDPGCGHCKKTTTKLKPISEELKDQGVGVYAVCTEYDSTQWANFVRDYEIGDWINVAELNKDKAYYKAYYDINSTPQIFLLDENKEIVAKKLEPKQLGEILKSLLRQGEDTEGEELPDLMEELDDEAELEPANKG